MPLNLVSVLHFRRSAQTTYSTKSQIHQRWRSAQCFAHPPTPRRCSRVEININVAEVIMPRRRFTPQLYHTVCSTPTAINIPLINHLLFFTLFPLRNRQSIKHKTDIRDVHLRILMKPLIKAFVS